jgi:hypothetical protein
MARRLYHLFYRHWGPDPKLKLSIDELKLESTTLAIQTMVTIDAGTDCAHEKVI